MRFLSVHDSPPRPPFRRSIRCDLGTIKSAPLAAKRLYNNILCRNAKTTGHNQPHFTATVSKLLSEMDLQLPQLPTSATKQIL
uniref:Uncharacterized protein n=1 Tax=Tanacetum cinerariifolium TaxID=118510 RepID=A0A6L2KDU1_TANCI|nr:hypothetical protein [Tanacetum cinerariifolium]